MSAATAEAARDDAPEEIPGQISGYWSAPWHDLPTAPPPYRPTGAVLKREGESGTDEFICLDLISHAFCWYPLSEAGALTYAHSSGLLNGEEWRFTHFDEHGRPTVFEVSLKEAIPPDEVARLYGNEAAKRTRPDRNALQLELRRV